MRFGTDVNERRYWLPLVLLVAAIILQLQVDAISDRLALAPTRARLLEQAAATGLWLAATYAGVTLFNIILNTAAVRRTGHRLPRLVTDLLAVVVWLVTGIGIASQVFDQPVGGLIATSSVALAVLGFAMRDTIASLFAAVAINVEGPYHLDDWISLPDGTAARIEEIGWFTTRALTRDRVRVVVPNSQLAASIHKNYGAPGWFWRDSVYLTLDAALPPGRVASVFEAALLDVEAFRRRPADRRADVVLHEVTIAGATWRLRYWLDDYGEAIELKDRVLTAALRHLHHAGLPPARPVREIKRAQLPRPGGDNRRPLLEQLATNELFASLDGRELEQLAAAALEHRLGQGATVIEAGSPGRSLFLLVEGLVDIQVRNPAGLEQRVSTLGPGSCFGEYALLCGEPRTATVRTVCQSLLFEIDRDALAPILQANPGLASDLSAILERRRSGTRQALEAEQGTKAKGRTRPRDTSDLVATIQRLFGLGNERTAQASSRRVS